MPSKNKDVQELKKMVEEVILDKRIVECVKVEAASLASELMRDDLVKVILYACPMKNSQKRKHGMHISVILIERERYCKDNEYYLALAKVQMERAKELLLEAKELLDRESYKSANNRAFYAIEKSVKALLATKQIEVATHLTMMISMWQAKKRLDSRLKVLTIL